MDPVSVASREVGPNVHVTGTQVNYYFVCKRKLWLFSHHITMEHTSDRVALGKLLGEERYPREKKDIDIDGKIRIDFLDVQGGVLHEVKHSPAVEEAHIWQVKYYLWYLKQKGIDGLTGEINYPRMRRKEKVFLTRQDEKELEHVLNSIEKVRNNEPMPDRINKKFCRKCSYFEFCWV